MKTVFDSEDPEVRSGGHRVLRFSEADPYGNITPGIEREVEHVGVSTGNLLQPEQGVPLPMLSLPNRHTPELLPVHRSPFFLGPKCHIISQVYPTHLSSAAMVYKLC